MSARAGARCVGVPPAAAHGAAPGLALKPTPSSVLLASLGGAVVLASAFLAAVHVGDRFGVDHVGGVRIALARLFDRGVLYPELFDGQSYGGSRFMPLPIVLHGSLARITGEYLVSGKLLSYALMVALVATVLVLVRRGRCPLAVAVALSVVVLATPAGQSAVFGLRADALAVVLQLVAVAVVAQTSSRPATLSAAALAALALTAKLSAIWGPVAIVIWLGLRDRRRLAWFLPGYLGAAAVVVGIFVAVSDGRILENVAGLATAGLSGPGMLLRGPYRLLQLLTAEAPAAWALLPAAAYGGWRRFRREGIDLYQLATLCCLGVLIAALADIGTGSNQLLDLMALVAILLGHLAGDAYEEGSTTSGGGLKLLVAWVILGGLATTIVPSVLSTVRRESTSPPKPLAGLADSSTSILSDDPYVPVSLGQDPVVLDPFMLIRIAERYPGVLDPLLDRIRRQELDLVVLVAPLDDVPDWWRELSLGQDVAEALRESYRYAGRAQGYYLYRPRLTPETEPSG